MSLTKVISVRVPARTLAQLTYILEYAGTDPTRLSMSSAVRVILEGLCAEYERENLLPDIEDQQAEKRIADVFSTGSQGLDIRKPSRFDPPAPPTPAPTPPVVPEAVEDNCEQPMGISIVTTPPADEPLTGGQLEAMRRSVHAQLEPHIQEAKSAVDAKRFFGISDVSRERVPSERDITPTYANLQEPWSNVALGSVSKLVELAPQVPLVAMAIKEQEHLTLLAARAALAELPIDVFCSSTGEEVIKDLVLIFGDYVSNNPGTAVPKTTLPKKREPKPQKGEK